MILSGVSSPSGSYRSIIARQHSIATLVVALGLLAASGCSGGEAPTGPAPAAVARIAITPDETSVAVASSVRFTATAVDASGTPVPQATLQWSTSDATKASVDQAGLVRGEVPGVVTITAKVDGGTASGRAHLTVLPALGPIVGERIVFNTNRDGNLEIYLMDPDGTDLINLTQNAADDFQPTWSPDGSRIAFASDRSGNVEIYAMNADGTGLVRLTDWSGWDLFPSWSGNKIAFERDLGGPPYFMDIFVMNEDGTDAVNVTNNSDFARGPSMSPDGTKIVFQSDRDFDVDFTEIDPEIYVMDADGSHLVNLTNDAGEQWDPAWSPDGSRIAFANDWDIYVMDADGSNAVNLTNSPSQEFGPAWSPSPPGP